MLAAGLAIAAGAVPLPERLWALEVLADPWVLRIAALGAFAEVVADKLTRLGSAWDSIHAAIRPLGGAALALALVDPAGPAAQALTLLAGGGAALLAHAGKVAARRVDGRPGSSNLAYSLAEDFGAVALLAILSFWPRAGGAVALVLALLSIGLLLAARKVGHGRHFRMPPNG